MKLCLSSKGIRRLSMFFNSPMKTLKLIPWELLEHHAAPTVHSTLIKQNTKAGTNASSQEK